MAAIKRFLTIDQGNTFIKLTLFSEEKIGEVCRVPSDSADEIFNVVERWRPECGCFCSVGRIDSRLVESLRMAVGGKLLVLSHSTPLPLKIEYSTPATLGLDRVALAAGASVISPGENVMVVDAGTAVTEDVIVCPGFDIANKLPGKNRHNDAGLNASTYIGGRIAPGLRLRFESLHQYTAALPRVNAEGPTPVAGDSTETSIRSGVILGLADEIVETFREYSNSYGCSRLLLTGGDAELLYSRISTRIPADYVPDLMAQGLSYIYKYNENK